MSKNKYRHHLFTYWYEFTYILINKGNNNVVVISMVYLWWNIWVSLNDPKVFKKRNNGYFDIFSMYVFRYCKYIHKHTLKGKIVSICIVFLIISKNSPVWIIIEIKQHLDVVKICIHEKLPAESIIISVLSATRNII